MAALALIMASCSSNEDNLPVDLTDTPITVNASVNPIAASLTVRSGGDTGGMSTSNLYQFNLTITNPDNGNYSYSVVMKPTTNGWQAYDSDNNVKQMLWANSTTPVKVKASTFAITDRDLELTVNENQSDEEGTGLRASDRLMWDNDNQAPSANGINVEFDHIMAKLNINVTLGNEYNLQENPIQSVVIGGTKTKGSFHRTRGWTVDDATAAANVTAHDKDAWTSGDAPKAQYEAILVPQVLKAGTFSVTFTINKKTYTWTYAGADKTMEKGSCYTLELKVGKDKVEGVSLTPTPWVSNGRADLATD